MVFPFVVGSTVAQAARRRQGRERTARRGRRDSPCSGVRSPLTHGGSRASSGSSLPLSQSSLRACSASPASLSPSNSGLWLLPFLPSQLPSLRASIAGYVYFGFSKHYTSFPNLSWLLAPLPGALFVPALRKLPVPLSHTTVYNSPSLHLGAIRCPCVWNRKEQSSPMSHALLCWGPRRVCGCCF